MRVLLVLCMTWGCPACAERVKFLWNSSAGHWFGGEPPGRVFYRFFVPITECTPTAAERLRQRFVRYQNRRGGRYTWHRVFGAEPSWMFITTKPPRKGVAVERGACDRAIAWFREATDALPLTSGRPVGKSQAWKLTREKPKRNDSGSGPCRRT